MSARAVRRVNASQESMETIVIPDQGTWQTLSQRLHDELFVDSNMGIIQPIQVQNENKQNYDICGHFDLHPGYVTNSSREQSGSCRRACAQQCCSYISRLLSFIPQLPCIGIQGIRSLAADRRTTRGDHARRGNYTLVREFTKFWPSGDISEDDKPRYQKAIQDTFAKWKSQGDVDASLDIQAELEQIAINGYLNRMQVCIELIDFIQPSACKYIFAITIMSCLYGNEDIAIAVVGAAGEHAALMIEEGPYAGATPLHFALFNDSKALLQAILENMTQGQKDKLFHDTTYGEIIQSKMPHAEKMLNMAVYEAGPEVIALLVEEGAEMHLQDSHGYNPFHICCILGKEQAADKAVLAFDALMGSVDQWLIHTQAFKSLRDEDPKHARELLLYKLFKTEDNEGLTPLKLAARHGQKALMERMLDIVNIYKFPQTKLGSLSRCYYDISEIDPMLSAYRSSKPSVLELLIMRATTDTDENKDFLQCLDIPIISRLVEHKWRTVRPFLLFWCLWHLLILSYSSFYAAEFVFSNLQPSNISGGVPTHRSNRYDVTGMDTPLLVNAALYLLYYTAVCIAVTQIQNRVKVNSVAQFFVGFSIMEIWVVGAYAVMTALYYIVKLSGSDDDTLVLGASFFLGWLGVMFFLRSFEISGVFSIIITEVLFKDLVRFLFVIFLMVLAFTLATLSITASTTSSESTLPTVAEMFLNYFKLALAINDYSEIGSTSALWSLQILYMVFLFVCSLLLLNMMIGAMSETYAFLNNDGINAWKRVRTRDAIVMEWLLPGFAQHHVSCIEEQRVVQRQLREGAVIERHFHLACTRA